MGDRAVIAEGVTFKVNSKVNTCPSSLKRLFHLDSRKLLLPAKKQPCAEIPPPTQKSRQMGQRYDVVTCEF